MTTSHKPGDVIKIRGGTFTAAPESTKRNAHGCEGCAGQGKIMNALCNELPKDCSGGADGRGIIWIAGTDAATTIALAEFALEAT